MNTQRNTLKTVIVVVISVILAVFFMWLALGDLDFEKIQEALYRVNYFLVFVAAFFAMLAYVFRAVRWNLLLEPMGYKISNSNAFWTVSFGYLMNLTIPRSGEFARATALYGVEKVPVEKSFATIVVERVVDLCFMFLFLLLTFVFNGKVLSLFFYNLTNYKSGAQKETSYLDKLLLNLGVENIEQFYLFLKISVLVVLIFAFVIVFLKFREKLYSFVRGIAEGLLSVFRMKNRMRFLFYSIGIWTCYFLSAYLVCFALQETSFLSFGDVFLIITAGTLGMMVPTSGGAGSFHIAIKLAIAGIFISLGKDKSWGEEVGLTYAIVSHIMQTINTLLVGFLSIPILVKRKIS